MKEIIKAITCYYFGLFDRLPIKEIKSFDAYCDSKSIDNRIKYEHARFEFQRVDKLRQPILHNNYTQIFLY